MLVNGINPIDFLRLLDWIDIGDVHHHRLVVRAHENAFQRLVRAGIDLLMRHEGHCQLGAEEAKLPRAQPSRQSTSAHEGSPGRIAPGGEGVITRSTMLTGGKTVTAELEVVVDRSVSGEKLLGMPD